MSQQPVWTVPGPLALGQLNSLELRQGPAQPPLPRPAEDRLGPLRVRAVEPLEDGSGWRLIVQPLAPGSFTVPPLALGDGRSAPPLPLTVPRTVAYGAPWMGFGGGPLDRLPHLGFPWAWTLPLLLPLAAGAWILGRRLRAGRPARKRSAAQRAFVRHWPPAGTDRASLDAAHAAGRALLAAHFGPEALSWGAAACSAHGLEAWAEWVAALDAARFGRPGPLPPLPALLAALEGR